MDHIAELYQDFYIHAESYLATHTNALMSRIHNQRSPSASATSLNALSRPGGRKVSKTGAAENDSTRQMLTANEISDRRKARRRLESRKLALEEAVERGVCEKIYRRIYRHSGTDDEERDEKLRSRAAALDLVGIGLRELLSSTLAESETHAKNKLDPLNSATDGPRSLLANARASLSSMANEKYPLGKLNYLTVAHQQIVEVLSKLFPSTSSADEVLPTLIYTIVTTPPEEINVVSNLAFIQRFRGSQKVDGEAAYCLTNLEAAIGFLETVDLSSIRPNEHPAGPIKSSSRPATPGTEIADPLYRGLPPTESKETPHSSPMVPAERNRPRSLSNLLRPRPAPTERAGDAFLHGADSAVEAINSALDSSFNFLFGRLREKQAHASPSGAGDLAVPRTLEDARKLVNNPRPTYDDGSVGDADSSQGPPEHGGRDDPRLLDLFAGRRPSRERSADSGRSTFSASARKVAFADAAAPSASGVEKVRDGSPKSSSASAATSAAPTAATTAVVQQQQQPQASSSFAAVESMKTLGNSLNPLRGFGMRFGRSVSGMATPTFASHATGANAGSAADAGEAFGTLSGAATTAAPAVGAVERTTTTTTTTRLDLGGVAPPVKRFVELRDARELNFFDVELLLRDYQRLVGVLKTAAAASE